MYLIFLSFLLSLFMCLFHYFFYFFVSIYLYIFLFYLSFRFPNRRSYKSLKYVFAFHESSIIY